MITRKQIQRLLVDVVLIVILSVSTILIGMVVSKSKRNQREQNNYLSLFMQVLPASGYQKVETDLVQNYSEINSIYMALDKDDTTLGYVLDIDYFNAEGDELHSLIAVSADGSKLIGYKHIGDEMHRIALTEEEIGVLASQTVDKPIPMAVKAVEEESDSEVESVTSVYGLKDGLYYAQSLKKDKRDFIDYVEIEVNDGVITRVNWDAFNVDRTTKDRSESSLTGAYTVSGENWATQSYNICHALIDYQDPDKLAMKSDGTTDIIPGVTCDVRCFVELAKECISNSRHGFTEEMYIQEMINIMNDYSAGFEDVCVKTDKGYIVYSFNDMAPLSFEGGSYSTIYEAYIGRNIEEDSEEDVEEHKSENETPDNDNTAYELGEDGVVRDTQNPVLTQSVDGIALSEVNTQISGIANSPEASAEFVSGINIAYKFLREYFNWMA